MAQKIINTLILFNTDINYIFIGINRLFYPN